MQTAGRDDEVSIQPNSQRNHAISVNMFALWSIIVLCNISADHGVLALGHSTDDGIPG